MVLYVQPELSKYTGRVIYKLIFPDRKVYVGYATTSHKRIEGHKKESYAKTDGEWKCQNRCKEAIREFGWENMQVEIMEFVPKWTSLRDRERYWIAQYTSYDPEYGYNSNKGGGGPAPGAYKHTTETKAKISASCMGKGTKSVTSCKIKEEYSDGTQLVEFVSYASAREAERQTGVAHEKISNCCLKKINSIGGRYWHFTKKDELVGVHRVPRIGDKPMPGNEQRKRAVFSVSPEGVKQLHESVHAAARTLSKSTGKKFDYSAISKCCHKKSTHHQGYKFYFA